MDVQAIIAQVSAALADAPEKLQALLADPRGTIGEIAGLRLGEGDLAQIVDGVRSGVASGDIDLSKFDLGKLDLGALDLAKLAGSLGGLFGRR